MVNARDAPWYDRTERGLLCDFEGEHYFPQVGVNLFVLGPGQPMAMYHWEADQEDYLVLDGEALAVVDGEERPLQKWDFLHTPAGVPHVVIGAGEGCVVLAIGARDHQDGEDWGAYPVDATAQKHGAGVERETNKAEEAYAHVTPRRATEYREGLLP